MPWGYLYPPPISNERWKNRICTTKVKRTPHIHHALRSLQSCHILHFPSSSFTRISQVTLDKACIHFRSLSERLPLMLALEPVPWTLPRHNALLFLMLLQSSHPNYRTCVRIPTYQTNWSLFPSRLVVNTLAYPVQVVFYLAVHSCWKMLSLQSIAFILLLNLGDSPNVAWISFRTAFISKFVPNKIWGTGFFLCGFLELTCGWNSR